MSQVAVAALSGGRAVVCNLGTRSLSIIRLSDGEIISTLAVDGMPAGVSVLDTESNTVAVSIQGRAESGASVSGVGNATDRIEIYRLANMDQAAELIWSELGRYGLSYPNGIASRRNGHVVAADWNNHRESTKHKLKEMRCLTCLVRL